MKNNLENLKNKQQVSKTAKIVKCSRLSMMILKPQPKEFIVRSEFHCNLYEAC